MPIARLRADPVGTRITVLVDDRVGSAGLAAEHGLALWIEHDGHRILFDTGASGRVLLANAAALGVSVEDAEAVCLSHGHYDHTGGLAAVLPRLRGARLYAHPAVFEPKAARDGAKWRAIGISLPRSAIEARGVQLRLAEGPQEVAPGVAMTGEVVRDSRFVPQTPHLCIEGPDGPTPDPFRDDQALVVRGAEGLIVVSGCAHAGIVNLCRAAQGLMNEVRLQAVIGGFHLWGASAALIEATIAAFRQLRPGSIQPCHCTGGPAMVALARAFPDTCRALAVGSVLEL
jgi:7,8-dihydropterin-6-yl-methyl-4-(beta-D-ribofuranosyl)aminobenzene 5'-phosphate synthase